MRENKSCKQVLSSKEVDELRECINNQFKGLRINDQPNNATAIMFGKKSDNDESRSKIRCVYEDEEGEIDIYEN